MKTPDELKALYGENYVTTLPTSTLRLGRLLSYMDIDKNSDIVDYGCGNGMLMDLLCPIVRSYSGVDFSSAFITAALQKQKNSNIANATFFCSDIHNFCSQNQGRFDAAYAMDFSEHVYDDEWIAILTSIKSTLKHNGALYIHTPNREFIIEIMKDHNFILKQFPEHVAVRNNKENQQLLEAAGFTQITSRTVPHYNILRFLHIFSYAPIVGKFFRARLFIKASA